MKRRVALVLLVLLVAASVSYNSGYTLDIVGDDGTPQTAYALYTHQGYWLNPVHPVSYTATRLTVIRSNDRGRLTIPAAFHVHWPFPLQSHPRLSIQLIYGPSAVRDVEHSLAGPLLELIGHFRAEYNAFLARHNDSPRPVPPMPPLFTDDDKRRWKAMVDADLSQRPTWGMEIRRLYAGEISNLTEMEASLKR
jgi:hypothetical protein